MSKICAIHQPNFFPWLGFFDKIRQADVFVILDAVQYQKTGGTWINRVKLDYQGNPQYFSCPIKRESGFHAINSVQFSDNNWKKRFLKTLTTIYGRTFYFHDFFPEIESILSFDVNTVAEFNTSAILKLSKLLGIEKQFVKQSDLTLDNKSTGLLIDITKAVGCDIYLCGGGAAGYQEDEKFKEAGIGLSYQVMQPKFFSEFHGKKEGLSILHHLFKQGAANCMRPEN